MLPAFPHELTYEILNVATLSLVDQERHDSTLTGQTNAFLLSASLVSRTWRDIAQPLLLKHGLVDPSRAEIFISEIERAGLKDTLATVRIGVPASGAAVSDDEARASGIGFERMLWDFQALRELEIVGQQFRVLGLVVPPNQITTLIFAPSSGANFEARLLSLCTAFNPLRLTFIEDSSRVSNDPSLPWDVNNISLNEPRRVFRPIRDLSFTASSVHGAFYPIYLVTNLSPLPKAIHSLRLEIKDARVFEDVRTIRYKMLNFYFESLGRLETHLDFLQDFSSKYGPNLAALILLWDPEGVQYTSEMTPEDKILNQISNLAALKELEVPDCWRSDAIEEACEAKSVKLTWIPKSFSTGLSCGLRGVMFFVK